MVSHSTSATIKDRSMVGFLKPCLRQLFITTTYIITTNIPVILSITLAFKNAIVEASHREYDVDDNTNGNYVMAQVKRMG